MDEKLLKFLKPDQYPTEDELNNAVVRLQARLEKVNHSQEDVITAFSNPLDPLSPLELALMRLNIDQANTDGEESLAGALQFLLDIALESQSKPQPEAQSQSAEQPTPEVSEMAVEESHWVRFKHRVVPFASDTAFLWGIVFLGMVITPTLSLVPGMFAAEGQLDVRWMMAVKCIAYLILWLLYAVLRFRSWKTGALRVFPDSQVYLRIAEKPIWSRGFLAEGRPFTVSLFYKLLRNDLNRIVLFQLAFSLVSWGVLALACDAIIPFVWLKPLAFTVVLIFSMANDIIQWDKMILSESIGLSLQSLFIASWLWWMMEWQWYAMAVMLLTGFLWLMSRDTNAYAFLILAVIVGLGVWIGWIPLQGLWTLPFFLLYFLISNYTADQGQRWVTPLYNVIGRRILVDPSVLEWFYQQGMPMDAALMERRGHYAWDDDYRFYESPALEGFRKWFFSQGKRTYQKYLLTHLAGTVQSPLLSLSVLYPRDLRTYASPEHKPILPEQFDDQKYPLLMFSIFVLICGLGLGELFFYQKLYWAVALAATSVAYAQAIVVRNGDDAEEERHGLLASVLFRTGFWLSIFCLVISLVQHLPRFH